MIKGQSVLALIPARGGSKGLPGKNLLDLAGKPLITWSIEAALGSQYVDRIVLSSDDEEIMRVARQSGCEVPFKRDARLATDEAGTADVVLDALTKCPGFDWVLLLQPTSPLRSSTDIDNFLVDTVNSGANAAVSVCESPVSPYWMFKLDAQQHLLPIMEGIGAMRRQDLPPVYALNGALYAARVDWFKANASFLAADTRAWKMPAARSIDIDDELDLIVVRHLLSKGMV